MIGLTTKLVLILLFVHSCSCMEFNEALTIAYGIAFGLTAVIALSVALCCVYCECCPFYRHRGRNVHQQILVGGQGVVVGPNGVTMAVGTYPANVVPANNPPPYFNQQGTQQYYAQSFNQEPQPST